MLREGGREKSASFCSVTEEKIVKLWCASDMEGRGVVVFLCPRATTRLFLHRPSHRLISKQGGGGGGG